MSFLLTDISGLGVSKAPSRLNLLALLQDNSIKPKFAGIMIYTGPTRWYQYCFSLDRSLLGDYGLLISKGLTAFQTVLNILKKQKLFSGRFSQLKQYLLFCYDLECIDYSLLLDFLHVNLANACVTLKKFVTLSLKNASIFKQDTANHPTLLLTLNRKRKLI